VSKPKPHILDALDVDAFQETTEGELAAIAGDEILQALDRVMKAAELMDCKPIDGFFAISLGASYGFDTIAHKLTDTHEDAISLRRSLLGMIKKILDD